MRRKLVSKLYVGDLEDCRGVGTDPKWFVVHACRNPCYADQCGNRVDPAAPNYLSEQKGAHLYLNLIDPEQPLFYKKSFDAFLTFMRHAWLTEKSTLIHCNKGQSRAPSLCLLFLAKVARKITNASFDAAWDDFEKLAQEVYEPSLGIETWLREHWNEFPQDEEFPEIPVASTRRSGPDPSLAEAFQNLSNEEAIEMVRTQPLVHFGAFTQIAGKSHKWIDPIPNRLQIDISEAYDWCIANHVPCRLIILKPRQVGCSTYCAEVCYHHMRRFPSEMLMMGDVSKRTEKIWDIFQSIPSHDRFDWSSIVSKSNTEVIEFTYPDGNTGNVEKDTALDPKAGISGTRGIIWFSEVGRYKRNDGHDTKVMVSALNSLVNESDTLGIMESTAEGGHGFYYETWQEAATLERRKRSQAGNGWIKVFAAWFEFPEHSLKKSAGTAHYFDPELDDREKRGVRLFAWMEEQIAWRRLKIKTDCANDPRMFDQDFPEDDVSAFLASGRPRFNVEAVTEMEIAAKDRHSLAETGSLESNGTGGVRFDIATDDPWLWVPERPLPGLSYIGFTDPCTGAQSEGSRFPDSHGAGIIRAGYVGDRGEVVKARVVAFIDVPNGCRWDDEVLAERMKRLLDWYGSPICVLETGMGLGVLTEYQKAGITLYEREKMDAMYPGKKLRVAGWETNQKTRPILVNEMANYIRERALECTYIPFVNELRNFIVDDRGRAAAKSGTHDDLVMGVSLGLACIELAQVLMPPIVHRYAETTVATGRMGGINPSALS